MSVPTNVASLDVEAAFRVVPGLYVIGSLERGVTIYSQQVRAHNLAWALWDNQNKGHRKVGKVAIVGGGITGLTMAASLLSLFERNITVTLFERSWDLCPFQQGADTRWVHPRIYNWPKAGSRAPSASLPVLDWTEGRGSDVARTIVDEFSKFASAFAKSDDGLTVYLGLRHFQIEESASKISWVAHKALRGDNFFHLDKPEGTTAKFDTIILAAGFGTETMLPGYRMESYWRNEQLGQPPLDGAQRRYLISGYGDGALVDLCRLTIERFRQDTIVYELFEGDLEEVESRFADAIHLLGREANVFDLLQDREDSLLRKAIERLGNRIRKDTRVTLHLRGRNNEATNFQYIFGAHSSFLHRLIAYLLYRCGAFAMDFSDLATAVSRHHVDASNVLCRYGANTLEHLQSFFVDPSTVAPRFVEMKAKQLQAPQRLWTPGTFPHYSNKQA
jgi:hypothetical protein